MWLAHRHFRSGPDPIDSLEVQFDVKIAIIDLNNKNAEKLLRGNKSLTNQFLTFFRKPDLWENVIFFGRKDSVTYYVRVKLDEVLPYLAEKDCVLPISMDTILAKYGFPGTIQITEENLDHIEASAKIQIRIYDLRENGRIHSLGTVFKSNVINLNQ